MFVLNVLDSIKLYSQEGLSERSILTDEHFNQALKSSDYNNNLGDVHESQRNRTSYNGRSQTTYV